MDYIQIEKIRAEAMIGILPAERQSKQPLLISLRLGVNLQKACSTDNIEYTVNYLDVAEDTRRIVEQSSFFLIEKLASFLMHQLLDKYPIEEITVTVAKPEAIPFCASVAVELHDKRPLGASK